MPGRRTDAQRVPVLPNRVESGDPPDVHEDLWVREAELHHGDEALPSREDLRPVAVLLQKVNRLSHRRGAKISERVRLHSNPPPMQTGITGNRIILPGKVRVASWANAVDADVSRFDASTS